VVDTSTSVCHDEYVNIGTCIFTFSFVALRQARRLAKEGKTMEEGKAQLDRQPAQVCANTTLAVSLFLCFIEYYSIRPPLLHMDIVSHIDTCHIQSCTTCAVIYRDIQSASIYRIFNDTFNDT